MKLQQTVWRCPYHFIAFGFGAGLMPCAPGTFGTLIGIILYILLAKLTLVTYLILLVFLFVAGIYLCERVSKALGVHDHSGIVWDEIVGILLACTGLTPTILSLSMAFILFRVFDILKPFPINMVDKNIDGGLGIMLDDVVAALPVYLILQLLQYIGWIA